MRHEPRKIAPCVGVTDMGLFNLIKNSNSYFSFYRDCVTRKDSMF